jgi:uncharacterized LabA/DUF88 family protein
MTFPHVIKDEGRTIILNGELAHALISEPHFIWLDTYRERTEGGYSLFVRKPHEIPCYAGNCPVNTISHLIDHHECPKDNCERTLQDILGKREQKLVDCMIACDLLEIARQKARQVVVVSSDDDIWPAIRTVVNAGTALYHVHTRSRKLMPQKYTDSLSDRYTSTIGF